MIRTELSFSSILIDNINRLVVLLEILSTGTKKFNYFGRMFEKIPELETFDGIGGLFLCPCGKALVKNTSSKSTQPRDLSINRIVELN